MGEEEEMSYFVNRIHTDDYDEIKITFRLIPDIQFLSFSYEIVDNRDYATFYEVISCLINFCPKRTSIKNNHTHTVRRRGDIFTYKYKRTPLTL
jgi:hypothetical protein